MWAVHVQERGSQGRYRRFIYRTREEAERAKRRIRTGKNLRVAVVKVRDDYDDNPSSGQNMVIGAGLGALAGSLLGLPGAVVGAGLGAALGAGRGR